MDGEVVVKVEGEAPPSEAAENTVDVVIEKALEIAEKIDEARQEGEENAETLTAVKWGIDDVYGLLISTNERITGLVDMVAGLYDAVASLQALEVAEVVVEKTEKEAVEILQVADAIEDAAPPPPVIEEVKEVSAPAIRKDKSRRWV